MVYSLNQQRVWLVEENGTVSGSWLVSGRPNIPKPGEYHVYSRSLWSRSGSARLLMVTSIENQSAIAVEWWSNIAGRKSGQESTAKGRAK